MSPAASAKPCPLLDLSAELRNLIYEEVLVEKETLIADKGWGAYLGKVDRFAQPGLLQTCRQIRTEASSVYYLSNRFLFEMSSFNPAKLIAFCRQAGSYKYHDELKISVKIAVPEQMSWSGLLSWLKADCENEAPGLAGSSVANNVSRGQEVMVPKGGYLVWALFNTVDELYFEHDLEWSEIESFLECYKTFMGRISDVSWKR